MANILNCIWFFFILEKTEYVCEGSIDKQQSFVLFREIFLPNQWQKQLKYEVSMPQTLPMCFQEIHNLRAVCADIGKWLGIR